MKRPPPPLPLSVLTGFLGSGKTTLLNGLLRHQGMSNTAVIINEFGEIGLDHQLVEAAQDGVLEMSSGCLCCTIRGELVDTLEGLLRKRDNGHIKPFDRVVIETTGLADPAPVLHTLMMHPYLCLRFSLASVITTVDAINGLATLEQQEESVKQVAVADRLVITKTDLLDTQERRAAYEQLQARLRSLNPGAIRLDAARGEAVPEALFNAALYDPQTKTADVRRWLNAEAYADAHHHHHHDVNRHEDIRAFAMTSDEPIAFSALELFLDLLRGSFGDNLLRLKGIVRLKDDPDRPLVIHAVQQVFHPPAFLTEWPDEDRRTRIVLIGRELDEKHINDLFDAFSGKPKADMASADALLDNPLSLRGG